jgi:hypothetical protein
MPPEHNTGAMELAGRLEEESLGLQQLAWSRADGGQHLSIAASLMDQAAALIRTQAEGIERLRGALQDVVSASCFAFPEAPTYAQRAAAEIVAQVNDIARRALPPPSSPPLEAGRKTGGEG